MMTQNNEGQISRSSPTLDQQRTLLAKVKHWTGLDRAIAFTVLARGWAAIAGAVTVLLIAKFLSPAEQGYYFTFSSLVAVQVVFELGFSFVLLQLAAHERTLLTFHPDGTVTGDVVAFARIASILQKSVKWYSRAAVLMAATLLPLGFYFFTTHQAGTVQHWRTAWVLLVIATAATFQINPVFSYFEGCGFVAEVARLRFSQAFFAGICAWSALISHHGLYAPAATLGGQAIVGGVWLFWRRPLLKNLLSHEVGDQQISWKTEIWPFQWRIAISWLSGYFIYQIFSPVLFAYQGAVAAGQMGMSITLMMSIGTIALAWMNTKASPFGSLVAQRNFSKLDHLFFRTLKQSTLFLMASDLVLFGALLWSEVHFPHLASRVLPPRGFALLLAAGVANHIVFCQALYLRAHKREPFMGLSLFTGILVTSSTYILGRYTTLEAVAWGFLSASVIFAVTATYIFVSKRREWHQDSPDQTPEGPTLSGAWQL